MRYRITVAVLIFTMIFSNITSYGQITWMDGGVVGDPLMESNLYEYSEICFITGVPVKMLGTVKIPQVDSSDESYSMTYEFDLEDSTGNNTISRSITYDVIQNIKTDMDQTLYHSEISKFDETISMDGNTYTLDKYNFSDDRIIDNTSAVDYYSGNIYAERTYYINGDRRANDGFVEYTISTEPFVGYDHKWGASETRILNHLIKSYVPNPDYDSSDGESEEFIGWTGDIDVKMSSTRTTDFQYQNTDPQNISFRGSYFMFSGEENILNYVYDLPEDPEDYENQEDRNQGDFDIREDVTLAISPLVAPKIRDIGGHWAEDSIYLLTSMEIFGSSPDYFVPDQEISRIEFGIAVANAIADIDDYTVKDQIRNTRPGVETPFLDVLTSDENYNYIEFLSEEGIFEGVDNYLKGDQSITRQEAIAILIRTLGLDYLAPAPPYTTSYKDDSDIQEWAKDSIYMANEIGLVTGYEDGTVRPLEYVSRAETAVLIEKFIVHIKDDITADYREKIMNN